MSDTNGSKPEVTITITLSGGQFGYKILGECDYLKINGALDFVQHKLRQEIDKDMQAAKGEAIAVASVVPKFKL